MTVQVKTGSTVIQACESVGVEIPRFCYHERLLVAGNCRMCLVEIAGSPKPQAACALPVMPNMKIFTDSPLVKKARESVMEFLLLNHPLDCPICDQGGECDRQDQSRLFGSDRSRRFEAKRGVEDKDRGALVKTVMTRCIHCTRCIRFASEVAGVGDRGTSGRGRDTEVGTYVSKVLNTELSGNLVDLCPVGALTSKPTAFQYRPWERETTDTVDLRDGMGSSVRAQTRGLQRFRIQPRVNDDLNQAWIGDKSRYGIDGLTSQRRVNAYVRGDRGLTPVPMTTALATAESRRTEASALDRWVSPTLSTEHRRSASRRAHRRAERRGIPVRWAVVGAESSSTLGAFHERSERTSRTAVSEADRVRLVGVNPRTEASAIQVRLRESFLRDRVEVITRGLAVASGEASHGLTFPSLNRGRSVEILRDRAEGRHPISEARYTARRPRRRVGANVRSRADGLDLRAQRRQRASRLEARSDLPTGWTTLHRVALSANRLTSARLAGTPSTPSTPRSRLVRRGVTTGDLREAGRSLPRPEAYTGRIALGSHGDDRRASSDVILPLRTAYEEDGTYVNTEGRSQVHRAAVTSALREASTTRAWLPCDHRGAGEEARSTVLSEARRAPRVHGREPREPLRPTRQGGVTSPSTPSLHDYYTEGHALARGSSTLAKASARVEV